MLLHSRCGHLRHLAEARRCRESSIGRTRSKTRQQPPRTHALRLGCAQASVRVQRRSIGPRAGECSHMGLEGLASLLGACPKHDLNPGTAPKEKPFAEVRAGQKPRLKSGRALYRRQSRERRELR